MAVDVQPEDDIREIEGLVGGYLRSPQDEATCQALLAELEKLDDQTARADAYSNFRSVLVRYQVPRSPTPQGRGMIMANALLVAGSNSEYKQPGASPAGFWAGLWHGIIAPITFIVSLFADGVRIYETNNNGRWCDFGFMLGIGAYASNHEVRQGVLGTSR